MSSVNSTPKIITADPKVAARYRADGWWSDERHADRIRKLAAERPNDPAYITETARFTW
jgi:non-ribosomal peptide synthetase component E (peptide arylation enzyme)